MKNKVKIIRQVKLTTGGKHVWYEALIDGVKMLIRKPLGKTK